MYPKVASKTNQKTEMPDVKDPLISMVSHHSKRKIAYTCCKRSSRKHSLPAESWVDLPADFCSNEPTRSRRQFAFNRKLLSGTFLRNVFIPVLRMYLKRRERHGCLLVITLFIFNLKANFV